MPVAALLLQLVERADIVLENFSRVSSSSSTLATSSCRTVKPDVIMVRMPGFGLEGPWRDYVGWAMVIEQATGMASVTGPPDRPMHPGGLADPVIGLHAAVAVQAALEHRDRTGEGQLIEVAQLETGANVTAELMIEWSARGEAIVRDGNRDRRYAPQGVYAAAADGEVPAWVALTVETDEQWRALVGSIGRADWADDETLATRDGRRARHDELDVGLSAWAATMSADECVDALRAIGCRRRGCSRCRGCTTIPSSRPVAISSRSTIHGQASGAIRVGRCSSRSPMCTTAVLHQRWASTTTRCSPSSACRRPTSLRLSATA